MNKKQKNILFVLLIVILIILIMLFNFFTDSYNVFHKSANMNIASNESDFLVKIYLKSYKNVKHDTLFIGASDAHSMFGNINYLLKNYSNNIFCVYDYKDYYILLKRYLKLHPETKHVILVMNYMVMLRYINEYDRGSDINLNLKDLTYLLLSVDALKINLKKFKMPLKNLMNKDNLKDIFTCRDKKFFYYFEINNPWEFGIYFNVQDAEKNKRESFKYIKLIFQLLKEKNIQNTVIIPPYNGLYLALVYKNKTFEETIEDFQRLLVNNSDDIYDFAFINKYTSQLFYMGDIKDVKKNYNYYYWSITHPGIIMGTKVYKVLLDPNESEKDIYLKLTKYNIEEQINKKNKLLEKYIAKNNNGINNYVQNIIDNTPRIIQLSYDEALKNMPDDVAKEYEYLSTKSK